MRRLLFAAIMIALATPASTALALEDDARLIRSSSSSAVYYRTDSGRYVFPDADTYFSWFNDFTAVRTVPDAELAPIPLKGVVIFRPGVRLVKITTDPKVYAVDARGTLRHLASESVAAALYGPFWNRNIVDLSDAFFLNYRLGEPIDDAADHDPKAVAGASTSIELALGLPDDPQAPRAVTQAGVDATKGTLPGDQLPDLAPFAPYDLRYVTSNDRTLLKFTATFLNRGAGALELNTDHRGVAGDGDFEAKQRIYARGGGYRDLVVGTLFWHGVHDHYHYNDFGEYRLELVKAADGRSTASTQAQKTTFCLRDDHVVDTPTDGPRAAKSYFGCTGHRQGVSVGWTDVYPYTLPDQYFDVTGLPAGTYKMTFRVDPTGTFLESRRDNNAGSTLVELNPAAKTLTVIAKLAPFANSSNTLPDGARITIEGSGDVYAIHANRKRKLRMAASGDTYSWPQAAVDAIPNTRFIKPANGGDIYMINDEGWRRRILNPTVFGSYGYDAAAIAPVDAAELASYPLTDLIARAGDSNVYSISERRRIGSVSSLPAGVDRSSVQVVNDVDFDAYAVEVVAKDLNVPWDIAFLPGGDMLVTERPGTVRRIGKEPAVIDLPSVLHSGEGGLMGMALHPNFAFNKYVYFYFTTADDGKTNRIVRFRLEGNTLVEDKTIVEGIPGALYHDGGQLAFGADGMLYATTGDAEVPDLAQHVTGLAGKTLRYDPEGGIPSDNPYGTAVWSYGHRNAQGIAWDDQGRMWQTEHGRSGAASGYDELNRIEKGKNYGWPTIQGDETKDGMVRPVRHSGATTTWAPSGIAFVRGKLYFAGLRGASLYESTVDASGNASAPVPRLANVYGRLRAVVAGPDGALYVSTSNRDGRGTPKPNDDKILRVWPDFLR